MGAAVYGHISTKFVATIPITTMQYRVKQCHLYYCFLFSNWPRLGKIWLIWKR